MAESASAVRGIRGATTVKKNEAELIYAATRELLEEIVRINRLSTVDIAAAFFSVTADLNSAFPARAAREMGWIRVPLFCQQEIDVPGALGLCIRVLLLVNTTLKQEQVKHVYLREAVSLRQS
ncbi:MAG TPA: chorismate mutase [Firmicutes bacterium]|nr:chorismate mutase [Bacillota bacterium]